MRTVLLSGKNGAGKYALVDDEDHSKLASYNWHVNEKGLIARRPRENGVLGKFIYMHRVVLRDEKLDKKKRVYFKNNNRLDVRKDNLRIVDMNLSRLLEAFSSAGVDECWIWTSTKSGETGYGSFGNGGAYRAVYESLVGPVPDGLELDHICHSYDPTCPGGASCPHRACVNPHHLEPVTRLVNTMRGRSGAALNAQKDFCKNGHPFNEENTALRKGKRGRIARTCRICERAKEKEYRAANQGKLSGPSMNRWSEGKVSHGTIGAYNQDKCRCEDCRAAKAADARARRQK